MKRTVPALLAAFLTVASPFPSFAGENDSAQSGTATAPTLDVVAGLIKKKDFSGAFAVLRSLDPGGYPGQATSISYLSGMALLRQGKKEESKSYFTAASADPLIGDEALYQLIQMNDDQSEFRELLLNAGQLRTRFPNSPLRGDVLLLEAKALTATGLPLKAQMFAREVLAIKGYSAAAKALWQLAQSQEAGGAPADAWDTCQQVYYEYPQTLYANLAIEEMARIKSATKKFFPAATAKLKMKRASAFIANRMYKEAITYINSLRKEELSGKHRAELMMFLGRAHERLGRAEDAVAHYREASRLHDREIRPEALYRTARIYWNRDEIDKTLQVAKQIVKEFPGHENAAASRYIMARMEESAGRRSEAIKEFERAVGMHPSSRVAEDCIWYAGWLRFLDGDYAGAEKSFARLVEKDAGASTATPMGLYWQIRARRGQGKEPDELLKRLQEKFPLSYYSLLASAEPAIRYQLPDDPPLSDERRLGEILRKKLEKRMDGGLPLSRLDPKLQWAWNSAQAWIAMGLGDAAKPRIDLLAPGVPKVVSGLSWLAWQYYRANCYSCVLHTLDPLRREEMTAEQFDTALLLLFPVAHWEAVAEQSRANGIDPLLVLSIIRQESLFDAEAVSVANAHGLMQIIPATAELTAVALKAGEVNPESLNIPELNIRLGSYYLAGLVKAENGSLPAALATYNAGPRPVEKWKQRFPSDDMTVFVERIPYAETREYVKKVLRNYSVYKRLYMENLNPVLRNDARQER